MIRFLWEMSIPQACGIFLAGNTAGFIGSVLLCWVLGRLLPHRRIFDHWQPLTPVEITAALVSPFFNTIISLLGWFLWKNHWIVLREKPLGMCVLDFFIMLLGMDAAMYFMHRVAHWKWIFILLHSFHHRHDKTNPLSLFVLHPLEVLLFGFLMILFLLCYTMSPAGLMAYLVLNILWGTLGHSGVEPFPRGTLTLPILKFTGSSTFHAEHHESPGYNFGFYTLIWDHLFGTLHPDYARLFRKAVTPHELRS